MAAKRETKERKLLKRLLKAEGDQYSSAISRMELNRIANQIRKELSGKKGK